MLVLSRKDNESLILTCRGVTIKIVVVETRNRHGSTRLGIEAPLEVNVCRTELLEKDADENTRLAKP